MSKDNEIVDLFDVIEEDTSVDDNKVEDKGDNTGDENTNDTDNPDVVVDDENNNDNPDDVQDDEPESIVKLVMKQVGVELEDEFEDSEEGIAQYTRKAAEFMADDFLTNKLPEQAKDFIQYLSAGGDPSTYIDTKFPKLDYDKLEFNEDDAQLHEQLIRAELVAKGYTGEEIKQELEDYKNGGLLETKAKRSLASLQAKQRQEQEQLVAKQLEAQQEAAKQQKEYWDGVKNKILKSSEFKGLKVPETEKLKFFDYIAKPIDGDKSQRDLDLEKLSEDDGLAIDWLLFKGFDLQSLVDRKAKDKNIKTLKDRLAESKMRKKSESRQSNAEPEIVL